LKRGKEKDLGQQERGVFGATPQENQTRFGKVGKELGSFKCLRGYDGGQTDGDEGKGVEPQRG